MSNLSPTERVNKAADDYVQALLDGSQYSGNNKAGQRIFSASMLGGEPLQHYLKFKHGGSQKNKYGGNTTGTIYQHGCDRILENNPRYISALRLKRQLPNGWVISGEMDHIDTELNVIIDNKVIAQSAYKEIMKNDKSHGYNLQLAVYQWLLQDPTVTIESIVSDEPFESMLALVNKGGAAARNDIYTSLHLDTNSLEDIEAMLIAETDLLEQFISNDLNPGQCDIYKYGKTKDVPNRCALYCDYNHVCPHYSSFRQDKDIMTLLHI